MRPESEKLLQIIGTDAEVGTHGAIPRYLALAYAIQNGEDHHHVSGGMLDRGNYREAMMELPPYLDQMSGEAFSRLMHFAHCLEFDIDREVGMAIKKYPCFSDYYPDQIRKRANFLQAFTGLKPPLFSYEELQKEEKVREDYPWHWIDAVLEVNPDEATLETISQLISSQDNNPLLWRIHKYTREVPNGDQYLDNIMDSIAGKIPEDKYETLVEHIAHSKSVRERRAN